jgi:hypothetical protein
LSLDFGLREFGLKGYRQRLAHYRRFVYEKGGLLSEADNRVEELPVDTVDRFRYRIRYFADSAIIGAKTFVEKYYQRFKSNFLSKKDKKPIQIPGLPDIFSLKRLSES